MNNNPTPWVVAYILSAVGILALLMYFGHTEQQELIKDCTGKGGVLVKGYEDRTVCLKAEKL